MIAVQSTLYGLVFAFLFITVTKLTAAQEASASKFTFVKYSAVGVVAVTGIIVRVSNFYPYKMQDVCFSCIIYYYYYIFYTDLVCNVCSGNCTKYSIGKVFAQNLWP